MNHVDLFSGIGGFALAAKWTGFETVVFCEKDEFCQKVLQKKFGGFIADPDVEGTRKQIENIRSREFEAGVRKKRLWNMLDSENRIPIIPEIRDFDGTEWRGATLLTGGFPCQPFSVAGKRKGKEDDRYLWPEMLRVIKESKPRWVLAENVAGIFKMALDTVLADLESEGYTTGTVVIPAASVNAPHRRDRIWIMGRSKESINAITESSNGRRIARKVDERQEKEKELRTIAPDLSQDASDSLNGKHRGGRKSARGTDKIQGEHREEICSRGISRTNQNAPDSTSQRLEGEMWEKQSWGGGRPTTPSRGESKPWDENWLEVATRFCRVDDGVPNRVDRLKSLGNAIVPQVAAEIMSRITCIMSTKFMEVKMKEYDGWALKVGREIQILTFRETRREVINEFECEIDDHWETYRRKGTHKIVKVKLMETRKAEDA